MRKIKAHYIFDGYEFHKYATLVVDDKNCIVEIQPESSKEEAGVEFYNGIVCPGFINAHCHLELSHLQDSITENCGLPYFISQIVSKRNVIPFSETLLLEADKMMQENGIVAVGDISNNSLSFTTKKNSQIYYHTFIELFDMFSEKIDVFNGGKQLYKDFKQSHKLSLSPHAPYSCSRKLISRIQEHASEYQYPLSIHNQEHNSENEMYQDKSGELFTFFTDKGADFTKFPRYSKTSIEAIAPHLPKKNHILFVHNIWTSEQDILFLKSIRDIDTFTFVLCPLSNVFIGNILPPLDLFMKHNISIAIGTDSLASNYTLAIIDELFCLQESNKNVKLDTLLQFATIQGAKALQIQNKFGSFKQSKKPGVLLLENVNLQELKLQKETKVRVLI